ncbi:MAG: glycosyltransferase family 4 protein [Nostoc sp. ChiSLP02]|nr:glycosyltransferase family 4 protein [Nostoc sp. DedSLP05]MDZ8100802.1 glycosyltransferase family 4 protein [Nostoc sp. DedSLP01]MDZ8188209.1 glycosyltransferase family 4 protein [Nostoc sp. ChiSLP02]
MRVIQVPFCFYPDSVGGTEVYVEALSQHLQQQGIEILVAAPGQVNQFYLHNQLRVRRFALSPRIENLREIYGQGDRQAALEFSRILEAEQPDVVHLHAFTSGVSLRLVQAAKKLQIPVVFTYHTPTASCQRGTMMRWGTQICDGKIDLHTCTQCTLQGLGLDRSSAKAIASVPPQVGRWLGNLNLQGRVCTALRMTELVSLHHTVLEALLSEVDRIVAVCNWVRDVLLVNHVPSHKITVIRQALCQNLPEKTNHSQKHSASILKIAFLGRLDPTKGIHILIEALQAVPQLPICLDIYGISRGANDPYQQKLHSLAQKDSRINFKAPVSSAQVTATLANYDLLAVPSQLLETGPLVVLEAFAAKVPIIGSDLGGIAELVESGVNGILVEPASVVAWSQALERLCHNRDLLMHLRSGIRQPQTMATVAQEMQRIYSSLNTKNKIVSL